MGRSRSEAALRRPQLASCCGLLAAKVVLCAMNVGSFAIAAGLVAVGAKKIDYGGLKAVIDAAGQRHLLVDPRLTLMVMGSLLMPLSMTGFWAAVVGARRTLFVYFCGVLLAATVLVYVSALCFLYASSDKATGELVAAYWDLVAAALQQESTLYDTSVAQKATATASRLLHNAGNMCIASAVLLLVALFCASRVAGHAWMLSRVGIAQSLFTTVLGAAVVYLATVTSQYNMGGDWAADFLGGVGGFVMLVSLGGVLALALHWRSLLWAHFLTLCLLALLLMAATVVCLTYGSARVTTFARTNAGKVPTLFRTRVLGCTAGELAAEPLDGGNATLAPLNLTSAAAASVLECAVDPEAAQRWWEQHLTGLGALGAVLLVVLLCNLVATGYLVFAFGEEGGDEGGGSGSRRRRGGRDKRRRRRRRHDSSSDESSDEEGVQLAKRGSLPKGGDDTEP